MSDIDQTKNIYLFIHGQKDLEEKSINLLVENGFLKEKIILAKKEEAGKIDDYVAMLWMPPNPDHIKIHYDALTENPAIHLAYAPVLENELLVQTNWIEQALYETIKF